VDRTAPPRVMRSINRRGTNEAEADVLAILPKVVRREDPQHQPFGQTEW
jgi:hypothetical protein